VVVAARAAAAVPQPAAVAVSAAAAEPAPLEAAVGSGVTAVPRPVEAAAPDAGVGPQPVEAEALDAGVGRQPAEALDAAVRQPVEVEVLDAVERQLAAWGVPAVLFPASAEAARLSFPSLFPFPDLSAPGPAACFAHVRQSLRIASRTERSRQAARDEVWS